MKINDNKDKLSKIENNFYKKLIKMMTKNMSTNSLFNIFRFDVTKFSMI